MPRPRRPYLVSDHPIFFAHRGGSLLAPENTLAAFDLGASLGVDYSQTTSCYDPGSDGEACGRCDACQLRLKGFSDAGFDDPIEYATMRHKSGARAR